MGKKSRLKRERKQQDQGFEAELRKHPMSKEIHAFLNDRHVPIRKASRLLYVVSLLASFLIKRAIKKHIELPVISPEEDKADEKRLESLGRILEYECQQLYIESKDIMDALLSPMVANKDLMEPILKRVYDFFDSLMLSGGFRETTASQIENSDLWGDTLAHYADRKEAYFQTVQELFVQLMAVSRSALDDGSKDMDDPVELEEIRKRYRIEPDDFQKLRRRTTEFYRIAFAKYLSMVFQPLRQEVDEKIGSSGLVAPS